MCLAIPSLVKSINGYMAVVDIEGVTREVSLQLTPEAKVGDYVLLHTGYAIAVLDEDGVFVFQRLAFGVGIFGLFAHSGIFYCR